MHMLRRIDGVTGLAAGVFGLLGLARGVAGFSPEEEIDTVLGGFLVAMVLSLIGVPAGAYLCSRFEEGIGNRIGRYLLWLATTVLVIGTMMSFFSVGLLLLPAALLAVFTAIWATLTGME